MNRNLRKDSDDPVKHKAKRTLGLLLALALCLPPAIIFAPASKAANVILIGDVDGSGAVNKDDVTLLSQYLAGWEGSADKVDMDAADLNRDGKVTKADAAILARYAAAWDGYDLYAGTLFVKTPLTIVKEPVDVEMNAQSAVLSITVSGEFDSIVYEWQKKTAGGWRDAPTLNNDDATYTVNNSALQIISKNGTEGFGEYRCVVSAFYKGSLVSQVTSRTATVDPQVEPLAAMLAHPSPSYLPRRQYFYDFYYPTDELEYIEGEDHPIAEALYTDIMKSYMTQERFEYMITPQRLFVDEEAFLATGYRYFYSEDGFFDVTSTTEDTPSVYQDENGDWWAIPAARYNCVSCSIQTVSGGKGPYTYTWYLSQDRFGNDYQPLVEGYNCYGQGTENIIVWPSFEPDKGKGEPYFMGFLCCKVTDSKGRTTKTCYHGYKVKGLGSGGPNHNGYWGHMHVMLYAMDEDNNWFKTPNYNGGWWWTKDTNNHGIGRWN